MPNLAGGSGNEIRFGVCVLTHRLPWVKVIEYLGDHLVRLTRPKHKSPIHILLNAPLRLFPGKGWGLRGTEDPDLELPRNRVPDLGDYFQNIAAMVSEPLLVFGSALRYEGLQRFLPSDFQRKRDVRPPHSKNWTPAEKITARETCSKRA